MLAGGDVKLKAMPGAGDDAALQHALAQRPTLMRADAVERMELSADIEQRHDPLAGDKLASLARRAFGGGAEAMPHLGGAFVVRG